MSHHRPLTPELPKAAKAPARDALLSWVRAWADPDDVLAVRLHRRHGVTALVFVRDANGQHRLRDTGMGYAERVSQWRRFPDAPPPPLDEWAAAAEVAE